MKIRQCYANKPKKRKSCATKWTKLPKNFIERIAAFYMQVGDPE